MTTERDYQSFKLSWLGRTLRPLTENKKHRRRYWFKEEERRACQAWHSARNIQDSSSGKVKVRVINLWLTHIE